MRIFGQCILSAAQHSCLGEARLQRDDRLHIVDRCFSSDLPFQVSNEDIKWLLTDSEIVAPKGPAGTVIFFAANVAHASLPNLTPYARRIVFVTYNRIDNLPADNPSPRPEYIAGSSFKALEEIDDFGAEEVRKA